MRKDDGALLRCKQRSSRACCNLWYFVPAITTEAGNKNHDESEQKTKTTV